MTIGWRGDVMTIGLSLKECCEETKKTESLMALERVSDFEARLYLSARIGASMVINNV